MDDITKKLLSYQVPHYLQLKEAIGQNQCLLDASDTGTGKTYTAIALAKSMNMKPFVICPKSVIPSWLVACKHFDYEPFGIANYEMIKGCKYYTSTMDKVNCPYMDKIIIGTEDKNHKKKNVIDWRTGKTIEVPKKKIQDFVFQLPPNIMVIFDEAHRCKNYNTISSRLLLSIRDSASKILLLSATICDKLVAFKPFGVCFGFYDNIKLFNSWLRRQKKMNLIKYKMMQKDLDVSLDIIHNNIFPQKGSRMKISELGDLFPQNQIIAQSYLCNDYDKVNKQYQIINDALDDLKDKEKRAGALGKIIRARQRIEMYKLPIMIDLAEEGIDNGYSIVLFVNYLESLHYLAHHLKTDCLIHGEQNLEDRTACINDFQSNKAKVLIAIMQAGGVGISLHDINGGHPRMAILSPTWTGQDLKQALGRIHRSGSKTPALQKIVFCANTYEDKIKKIIEAKITNINMINDGDLLGPQFKDEFLKEVTEYVDHATVAMVKKVRMKKSKKTFIKN